MIRHHSWWRFCTKWRGTTPMASGPWSWSATRSGVAAGTGQFAFSLWRTNHDNPSSSLLLPLLLSSLLSSLFHLYTIWYVFILCTSSISKCIYNLCNYWVQFIQSLSLSLSLSPSPSHLPTTNFHKSLERKPKIKKTCKLACRWLILQFLSHPIWTTDDSWWRGGRLVCRSLQSAAQLPRHSGLEWRWGREREGEGGGGERERERGEGERGEVYILPVPICRKRTRSIATSISQSTI